MIDPPPRDPGNPQAPAPAPGSGSRPPEEPPPLLGTWSRLYAAVILYLAGLILLFTWFTRAFD